MLIKSLLVNLLICCTHLSRNKKYVSITIQKHIYAICSLCKRLCKDYATERSCKKAIIFDSLGYEHKTMSYFSKYVFDGEMAHARFMEEDIRKNMPLCSYRKYTLSEIINSVIRNGFVLKQFDEFPSWTNPDLPGEFVLVANK